MGDYMAKATKPELRRGELPPAPEPTSSTAADGMAEAQRRARQYLPDVVDVLAAIALSGDSECGLHTRLLAAKELHAVAFGMPQAVPVMPRLGDGSEVS